MILATGGLGMIAAHTAHTARTPRRPRRVTRRPPPLKEHTDA